MEAAREGQRVYTLFKRAGTPRRLRHGGMTVVQAKEVISAWLCSPAAVAARHKLRRWSWSRRATRRLRARAGPTPHPHPPRKSHWSIVRDAVRLRSAAFWWIESTVRSLCAPGMKLSLEDMAAYANEFCNGAV